MEESLPKIKFKFFFLSLLISSIYCQNLYQEKINGKINEKNLLQDDRKVKTIDYILTPGKVYNLNLYRLKEANIAFLNNREIGNNYLLIHFYPIECKIAITDSNDNEDKIYGISNYNYDAFYTLITKDNFTSFKIKPLIYSLNEENKNIAYPLIINSIKINNNEVPELIINETEPILFYFKDNLTRLKLVYNYSNDGGPLIVSFYIKEKTRFKIECNDGKENINKIIYYKEHILIKPIPSKAQYNILITKIDPKDSVTIIKITGNKSSPFYLQKNSLNLGFIPKNELCQYYYMKVYKGQEGEIILNNKRLNALLTSKIINKNENDDISNINIFPECGKNINLPKEYLTFDEYKKKLSFDSSKTKDCEDSCYLLVTYYSAEHNYLNITGNEYTLLSRVWDEEVFFSEIINIPLNEYAFGSFDRNTTSIHYYSIYIPEETENISIEMHGDNIISYAKKGIKKINVFKTTTNTIQLNKNINEKLIINLNKKKLNLDSYKGQYISFAFKRGDDEDDLFSYYYFRILQPNNNNIIIYPLDTNKDSLCETTKINGSYECYFLLKNEYQELSNKFLFNGLGQDDVSSETYCLNASDDYSIDLENLDKKVNYERKSGYLRYVGGCEDSNFALIKITSNYSENISFYSNFYGTEILEQTFDRYSYQSFYLKNNTIFFNINHNILNNYRIFINNYGGIGYLKFNYYDGQKDNIILEGSKTFSFSSYNSTRNIYFFSEKSFAFNIKINYLMTYEFMDELDCQYNRRDIVNKVKQDKFPIIYYVKDTKYKGLDINLYFKFKNDNKDNNDIIIRGGLIDYNDFRDIEKTDDVEHFLHSSFNGIYEPITKNGLIVFDKELSEDINNKEKKERIYDYFSFIIIDKKPNSNISEFALDINVIPKNDNKTFLILNKYTQSSINLTNQTSEIQKYFIDKETVFNDKFYIELSSNYENTYIEFNNKTNYTEKIFGGVIQYYLSISSNESSDYSFIVKVNRTETIKNARFRVNINLIYYLEEKKNNIENLMYHKNYMILMMLK